MEPVQSRYLIVGIDRDRWTDFPQLHHGFGIVGDSHA